MKHLTDGGSVLHFSFYTQDTSPLKVSLSNSRTQFSSSGGTLLSFSVFPKPLAMNAEFSEHLSNLKTSNCQNCQLLYNPSLKIKHFKDQ